MKDKIIKLWLYQSDGDSILPTIYGFGIVNHLSKRKRKNSRKTNLRHV